MTFENVTINDLDKVAQSILENSRHKIFLLEGKMGAGKTTLTKALMKILEIEGETSSPTFSIVNEYFSEKNGVIYHFDCYRLENIEEAYDFGCEEYLDSGNFCFIEWSDKIQELLPNYYHRIEINLAENFTRTINFK